MSTVPLGAVLGTSTFHIKRAGLASNRKHRKGNIKIVVIPVQVISYWIIEYQHLMLMDNRLHRPRGSKCCCVVELDGKLHYATQY